MTADYRSGRNPSEPAGAGPARLPVREDLKPLEPLEPPRLWMAYG